MFRRLFDHRLFWYLILALCVLGLLGMVFGSVYLSDDYQSGLARFIRSSIDLFGAGSLIREMDVLLNNDIISGTVIAALSSVMTLAWLHISKIKNMRRMAVEVLAYGYYDNFIKKLIRHCYQEYEAFRILIILPSHELIEEPDFYKAELTRFFKREGFELKDTRSDEGFARNAYFIQKKESPVSLPLFVDFPTTTRSLSKVLELESDTPIGKLKNIDWARRRFTVLIDYFVQALRGYLSTESFGNVRFIISTDARDFTSKVSHEIKELEQVLLQEMQS